jgi:hypothetical protein
VKDSDIRPVSENLNTNEKKRIIFFIMTRTENKSEEPVNDRTIQITQYRDDANRTRKTIL